MKRQCGRILGVGALALAVCFVGVVFVGADGPVEATLCDLRRDPAGYDRKLVRVTAFASHGLENFTLFDPGCAVWSGIWVDYGGRTISASASPRDRAAELRIEGICVRVHQDANFRAFDKWVRNSPNTVVRATLVGRFFSGRGEVGPEGTIWGGYGHRGCCSLFAIERVVAVDAQDRADLDYVWSADQPTPNRVGCSYGFLMPLAYANANIEAQRKADNGERAWSFDDPKLVAVNALAEVKGVDKSMIGELSLTREAPGRRVFEWTPPGLSQTYRVVVSRPYWLSYYAKDPQRVSWVAVAAYETSCP